MRRLVAAAAVAVLLAGCQTAKVTLLNDEGGSGAGQVAVFDPKTGAERGEVRMADDEVDTAARRLTAKKSKRGGFASLFGFMPKPVASEELEFEVGTTRITDASREALGRLLDLWKREREISDIEIIGYADSTGKTEDNTTLSIDRANAIRAVLESEGFQFTQDNSLVVGRGDIQALKEDGPGVANPKWRKVTVVIR